MVMFGTALIGVFYQFQFTVGETGLKRTVILGQSASDLRKSSPDLLRGVPGLRMDDWSHRLGEEVSMLEEGLVDGDHDEDGQDGDDAETEDQAGVVKHKRS